jgi:hypothetical protein
MVRVSINRWAGTVVYLLAITWIGLLGTKLSSVVAQRAIVLALPHLDNGPPKPSLIEKRRIYAALAAQPLPEGGAPIFLPRGLISRRRKTCLRRSAR